MSKELTDRGTDWRLCSCLCAVTVTSSKPSESWVKEKEERDIEVINNTNGHVIDSFDIENYKNVIKKIEIEKKTNSILQKKIEARKVILEKLERKIALNNLKMIIKKFYNF